MVNGKKILPMVTVFFSIFLVFILSEVLVRFFRPQATYSKLLLLTGEQYTEGGCIPFTLKANYKAKSPSMEFPGQLVNISTNSLGLRGKETTIKKPDGIKRILILGDSYTFGVYCEDNDVYPAILETLYDKEGLNVEVLNAGYADGWTPDEHYAWLVNRGMKFMPDIIIYGFFIGNDITGINTSKWVELDNRDLPTKITNPNIYIDKFGRIRSKVKDAKTVAKEFIYKIPLLRESHFFILGNRAVLKLYKHISDFETNNGWGNSPFAYILEPFSLKNGQVKEKLFIKLVNGMFEVANENHVKFLLLMIPVNFQVKPEAFLKKVLGSSEFKIKRDYFKEIQPVLDEMDIEYVNLLAVMKNHPEGNYYPKNGEVHFNPTGHEFTANTLKKKLDELHWIHD